MTDKTPELATLIEPLVDLACDAGRKILTVYDSEDVAVEEKDDKSPLTAADLASHHAISEDQQHPTLRRRSPPRYCESRHRLSQ